MMLELWNKNTVKYAEANKFEHWFGAAVKNIDNAGK